MPPGPTRTSWGDDATGSSVLTRAARRTVMGAVCFSLGVVTREGEVRVRRWGWPGEHVHTPSTFRTCVRGTRRPRGVRHLRSWGRPAGAITAERRKPTASILFTRVPTPDPDHAGGGRRRTMTAPTNEPDHTPGASSDATRSASQRSGGRSRPDAQSPDAAHEAGTDASAQALALSLIHI